MARSASDPVLLGRITGAWGVRGWVRVASDTEPAEGILAYRSWRIVRAGDSTEWRVESGRRHQGGLVVKLEGVDDRDAALALIGAEVAVQRAQLAPPGEHEYYWVDLLGAEVTTKEGRALGRVDRLLATGANDVLVVRGDRERLIPFIQDQVVLAVDLEAGRITVDWDPDF